ncbi:MAG: PqqD family protein [Sulfolobaceae archaeon]|nr:PqqD family protein [Sulfolobaceae archaeon]
MELKRRIKLKDEKFGVVVFDTETEKVFVTNQVGKEIINKIKEGKSIDQIIEELSNEYEGEKEQIRNDVYEFIDQLKKMDLLKE